MNSRPFAPIIMHAIGYYILQCTYDKKHTWWLVFSQPSILWLRKRTINFFQLTAPFKSDSVPNFDIQRWVALSLPSNREVSSCKRGNIEMEVTRLLFFLWVMVLHSLGVLSSIRKFLGQGSYILYRIEQRHLKSLPFRENRPPICNSNE